MSTPETPRDLMAALKESFVVTHELKCSSLVFDDVDRGVKTFEVRRNDRRFCAGHWLWLREYERMDGYSGRECRRQVTYVCDLGPFGVDGFVGMSLAPVDAERERLLDLIETLEANLASLARVAPAPNSPMERLRDEMAMKVGTKARDLLREYGRLGKEGS